MSGINLNLGIRVFTKNSIFDLGAADEEGYRTIRKNDGPIIYKSESGIETIYTRCRITKLVTGKEMDGKLRTENGEIVGRIITSMVFGIELLSEEKDC